MLLENGWSKGFQAKVVNIACYIQNCVFIKPIIKKTSYELQKGKKLKISYFYIFGFESYILNTKDKLSKFDPKYDPDVFLRYSYVSKAYMVYNKETQVVEETIHISFKEKKKDIDQNDRDSEKDMENLSLNNDS